MLIPLELIGLLDTSEPGTPKLKSGATEEQKKIYKKWAHELENFSKDSGPFTLTEC